MTLPLFIVYGEGKNGAKNDANLPDTSGATYTLPSAVATHAIKSMRLSVDDELQLSDGQGTRIRAHIIDSAGGVVSVDEIERESAPSVKLGLIQALAKGGRDEQAIEMATEIGVDVVIPWQAHRSIVQWKGSKAAKALSKWKDVLVGATEQSRRAFVPALLELKTTKQLALWLADVVKSGDLVLVLHQDATDTWSQLENAVREVEPGHTVWVVVGPEGGISDEEIALFKDLGAHALVVGKNILRASSAGSVALTLLSRVLGRYE